MRWAATSFRAIELVGDQLAIPGQDGVCPGAGEDLVRYMRPAPWRAAKDGPIEFVAMVGSSVRQRDCALLLSTQSGSDASPCATINSREIFSPQCASSLCPVFGYS
jgi:hypothetical protein